MVSYPEEAWDIVRQHSVVGFACIDGKPFGVAALASYNVEACRPCLGAWLLGELEFAHD